MEKENFKKLAQFSMDKLSLIIDIENELYLKKEEMLKGMLKTYTETYKTNRIDISSVENEPIPAIYIGAENLVDGSIVGIIYEYNTITFDVKDLETGDVFYDCPISDFNRDVVFQVIDYLIDLFNNL